MHGVSRGVKDGDVVLQDVEMKGRSQQPPLARPLVPVAQQQTLSCNIREIKGGGEDAD